MTPAEMKTGARTGARARGALIVGRLEALRARQVRRRVPRRTGPLPTEAAGGKAAAQEALQAARRRKESLAMQARRLCEDVCREAMGRRRKSLHKDLCAALTLRLMRDTQTTCDRPPAHTRSTWKVIRALDRAEALLLRLVSRGASGHAG